MMNQKAEEPSRPTRRRLIERIQKRHNEVKMMVDDISALIGGLSSTIDNILPLASLDDELSQSISSARRRRTSNSMEGPKNLKRLKAGGGVCSGGEAVWREAKESPVVFQIPQSGVTGVSW
eukprot:GHVH01015437.1.p2 GENE.GHVH01015437.1~~GHVH01015437.1.p2  ORF type:complete len:121 (-),score=22.38 GHVH01015437.1:1107-1469(-)